MGVKAILGRWRTPIREVFSCGYGIFHCDSIKYDFMHSKYCQNKMQSECQIGTSMQSAALSWFHDKLLTWTIASKFIRYPQWFWYYLCQPMKVLTWTIASNAISRCSYDIRGDSDTIISVNLWRYISSWNFRCVLMDSNSMKQTRKDAANKDSLSLWRSWKLKE